MLGRGGADVYNAVSAWPQVWTSWRTNDSPYLAFGLLMHDILSVAGEPGNNPFGSKGQQSTCQEDAEHDGFVLDLALLVRGTGHSSLGCSEDETLVLTSDEGTEAGGCIRPGSARVVFNGVGPGCPVPGGLACRSRTATTMRCFVGRFMAGSILWLSACSQVHCTTDVCAMRHTVRCGEPAGFSIQNHNSPQYAQEI